MSEEEYIEHEIVDRLYCLQEQDFDKTKVDNGYIQSVLKAGKENKNLIDKLQKENEYYKKENSRLKKDLNRALNYSSKYTINTNEIKQLVGYEEDEDVSKDDIISLIKLMWEEFNRLEDIEDYMETQCISKKKIKEILANTEEWYEDEYVIAVVKIKELLGE